MTATRRPAGLGLLPTAPLGSHALPALYLLALEGLRAGGAGEADVREAVEDAAQLAILDQERAGLEIVSDGEVRRHDFILSFYARLAGLRETPPARLGPYLYDSTPAWDVVDPGRRPVRASPGSCRPAGSGPSPTAACGRRRAGSPCAS